MTNAKICIHGITPKGLCKVCTKDAQTLWRKNNPERLKEHAAKAHAKSKHKSAAKYRQYARARIGAINPSGETKEGMCPICLKVRKLVYDHDHTTGLHRGWPCNVCNTRLEWFEDCKERVVIYLGGAQTQ